jgi:hypothetical protein
MKYMADDGTVFSTEAECLAYENNPMKQLTTLVKDKIDWSYSDVAGIQIIEESSVLGFIINNIDEINKILKTKDELSTSDGWISNVGRDRYGYPKNLRSDTKIEAKFRGGETETGYANKWGTSWMDEGEDWDIIAYRIR